MDEMTIGEVARYAGIQTSAIRYYESEGLLPPPKRVNGNRRYDQSVLKRLALIQMTRDAGFGIRELQDLFSGLETEAPVSPEWQTLATKKIAEMDALIQRAETTKAWLSEALARECRGNDDCITVMIDESDHRMEVTYSCKNSNGTIP